MLKKDIAALRKIRKMVEATHWIKGAYYEPADPNHDDDDDYYGGGPEKDSYCLVGFVNMVTGLEGDRLYLDSSATKFSRYDVKINEYVDEELPPQRARLLEALSGAIKARAPRVTAIEQYNDRPSTKRKDIVSLLTELIGS